MPIVEELLFLLTSLLAVIVIGSFLYLKNKETSLFLIIIYLTYSLIADLLINPFIEQVYGNASFGPRVFTIVEYLLISIYIYIKIKSKLFKIFIPILSAVFLYVCVYDFLTSDKNDLDSISIGTSSIFILFYLIYFLIEYINENNDLLFHKNTHFWIVAGLIMYLAGSFFTLISSSNKFTQEVFRPTYMIVITSFALLRNTLFLVGFFISKRTETKNITTK